VSGIELILHLFQLLSDLVLDLQKLEFLVLVVGFMLFSMIFLTLSDKRFGKLIRAIADKKAEPS